MCFSATVNFAGSAVLGAAGVVTLTKVKHRRELLFAAMPLLFAIHQFIEGFVWLGLDGILSHRVAHDMGAAFMLYAQGLLPFLTPLAVYLFEPNAKSRGRMLWFAVIGGAATLYILWALTAFPTQVYAEKNSIVYMNQATNNLAVALIYVIVTCGSLFFFADPDDGCLRRREPDDPSDCHGGEAVRIHIGMVRVCGGRERDHPRIFLGQPRRAAISLCVAVE